MIKEVEPGFVMAQHRWRKDKDGKPLVEKMSTKVFKTLPAFRGEDPTNDSGHTVDIPKQGWDLIDPDSLKTPKAAVEAQNLKEKAAEDAAKALEEKAKALEAKEKELEARAKALEAQSEKAQEETKSEEVVSESTEEETASEEAPSEAQEATKQSSTSSRRRRNTKPK